MDGETKTSPWVYVAFGCTAIVVLAVVAVAAVGILGYRWAKQIERDVRDPSVREAKVKQVLGSERLPEGYHPMVSLSLPLVMEMAMLSDRAPDSKGQIRGFDARGFVFIKLLNPAFKRQEMRDYFEGKTDDPSVLRRSGIKVDVHSRQILRRGVFDSNGDHVLYLAERGRLDWKEVQADGVNALMLVDCPQDDRMRMAIWFGPDPAPEATPEARPESARFAGSPADEAALRAFMGHFSLCRQAP